MAAGEKESSMRRIKRSLRGALRSVMAAVTMAVLALALVPSAALAATVEISGTGSLTVTGVKAGATVVATRVSTTQVDDANGTVVKAWVGSATDWGNVGDLTGDDVVVANKIAAYVNGHADEFTETNSGTASDGGEVTLSGLKAGLYLITVTGEDATTVYQNTLVPVNPTQTGGTWNETFTDPVSIALKSSQTGITKTVGEGNGAKGVSINTLSKFDTASFDIAVSVPTYADLGSGDRVFTVTDTVDAKYFDLNSVSADKITVTGASLTKDADYTVSYDQSTGLITVDFTNAGLEKAKGQTVTISYEATVSATEVGEVEDLNTATLTFSTKSYGDDTTQDSSTVTAEFYGLKLIKTDKDDASLKLKDATFDVYKGAGTTGTKLGTATTDENGAITFTGFVLGDGDKVTLVETKAPAGYSLLSDNVEVTVSAEGASDYYVTTTVTNSKDTTINLPSTGGAGTIGLTVAGVAIMAGAAAFVVRSRKQND